MVDEDALGYIKSGWFNFVLVWMGCRMYVVHSIAIIIMVVWTNLKIDKLTADICFPITLHKFQIDTVKVLYLVFSWMKCPLFVLPQIACLLM